MISVCILTKNSERTLRKTLDSVRAFSEVLLLDTGSTDATFSIAEEYPNVAIHKTPFTGFGTLRNQIGKLAKNNWILALDSDEILSPPLIEEMQNLPLIPETAYVLPRHNYYNGKRIKGSGWGGDCVARLYHRDHARFSKDAVHESLQANHLTHLRSPLLHTPYRTTFEFLAKMQHYSSLFAEEYKGKRTSSFGKAILHAAFAFFRSYILKRGLFDGKEGFIISVYNANTAFYKYLKLAEYNRDCN